MVRDNKAIGERVLAIRQSNGWTMQRLANEVGVTRGTVNNYEKGRVAPAPGVVKKLLAIRGCPYSTVFELYHGVNEKEVIGRFLSGGRSEVDLTNKELLGLAELEPRLRIAPAYILELEERGLPHAPRFKFEEQSEYREQLPAILEFLKREKGLVFELR